MIRGIPCTGDDRPRERLVRLGPRALALRELLALVLGAGVRNRPAVQAADAVLLRAGGSARGLARLSPAAFAEVEGIGPARAARLAAALELGRRGAAESAPPGDRIRGPADVWRRVGPVLRDLDQEEFHALLLNTQHRVVREVFVTRGILDASLIHPREVFRPAVAAGAAAVILVHNHPSGDPSPSPEDRAVTRQLAGAGRTLGIPVLDHVIVGDGRWAALSDEGPL
ncbi:RadC family protein [Gaopeijia maritima]|uniref:RadC family protein n=1 Tax=Gaopeijia maritima TaxID=3119007 RepID=UPI003272D954